MERISLWKKSIDRKLKELFSIKEPKVLSKAMSYYLFQPGKRIRPLITVAVTDALGGNLEDAITVGCAIEIIHNYSLIHDDLPAMDNDDFRRGLPSCHKRFGEALAILAGDALLTYAFELLSRKNLFRSLSAQDILEIISVIAIKSGAEGMVGGQALDIGSEEDLERINLKKTAALFEACFICGGIVSHRKELIESLEEMGRLVGLLFQITDDILDKDGYYKLLGKNEAKKKAQLMYRELTEKIKDVFDDNISAIAYLIDLIYKRII